MQLIPVILSILQIAILIIALVYKLKTALLFGHRRILNGLTLGISLVIINRFAILLLAMGLFSPHWLGIILYYDETWIPLVFSILLAVGFVQLYTRIRKQFLAILTVKLQEALKDEKPK